MSFKDVLTTPGVAPPWLLGAVGKLKLQLWGATIDQLSDGVAGKSAYAAEAGMPTKCDPSALPLIGQDRLITQGPAEPTATYRVRLKQAVDTWRQFAGNDWGIMIQVLAQVTGLNGASAPRVRCVNNSNIWRWFEAGADTTQPPWLSPGTFPWIWDTVAPGSPDTSNPSAAWWRTWLSIESVGGAAFASQWPSLGTGGQPTLGNLTSGSLGFNNVSSSFWTGLRAILETFRAKQSAIRWVLVTFGTSLIDPSQGGDDTHNPDGTWGYGYEIISGQYQAAWAPNILPVPGAYGGDPPGSSNFNINATFGYRIVQGQYVPL